MIWGLMNRIGTEFRFDKMLLTLREGQQQLLNLNISKNVAFLLDACFTADIDFSLCLYQ